MTGRDWVVTTSLQDGNAKLLLQYFKILLYKQVKLCMHILLRYNVIINDKRITGFILK